MSSPFLACEQMRWPQSIEASEALAENPIQVLHCGLLSGNVLAIVSLDRVAHVPVDLLV